MLLYQPGPKIIFLLLGTILKENLKKSKTCIVIAETTGLAMFQFFV